MHFRFIPLPVWIIFIVITLSNIYFFLKRNESNSYIKKASYDGLYTHCNEKSSCIQKWKKIITQYSKEDIRKGKELSYHEANLINGENSFSKITKISSWLINSLSGNYGEPNDSMNNLSL
ncbi:MAG: hypothetical protein M3O67_08295, partial [Bacteroidota bacterium]|nr:hypothetical protein [Bacteroidota bacterium]